MNISWRKDTVQQTLITRSRSASALLSLVLCGLVTTNSQAEESNHMEQKDDSWQLVWEDNFDGQELDNTKWNRQTEPAGRFNDEWQRYTSDTQNAFVKDGYLTLQANHHSNEHGLNQYSSARLNTAGKGEWQYGRIVARIKLPKGEGVWPAFWTLGANIDENGGDTPWPKTGEIDILELYGSKDDAVIEGNMHYYDNGHAHMGAVAYKLKDGIFAEDFHEFELQWGPQQLIWKVDGNTFHSVRIDKPEMTEFHHKHFLLLNIAIGGKWAGRPDDTTPFPVQMVVDWVKVYQQRN